MKNLVLLILFSFVFFSCRKDYFVPDNEVPDWLKQNIEKEEQIIKDSPHMLNSWGAWMRFKWRLWELKNKWETWSYEKDNFLSHY